MSLPNQLRIDAFVARREEKAKRDLARRLREGVSLDGVPFSPRHIAELRTEIVAKHQEQKERVRADRNERTRHWSRERSRINREWADAYKAEHGCFTCGEKDPRCLDFHHIDRRTKIANVSVLVAKGWLIEVQAEVVKCIVVCANCHRKTHAEGRY